MFLLIDSILLFLTFNKKDKQKLKDKNNEDIQIIQNMDTTNEDYTKIDKLVYEYDSKVFLKDILETDKAELLNEQRRYVLFAGCSVLLMGK